MRLAIVQSSRVPRKDVVLPTPHAQKDFAQQGRLLEVARDCIASPLSSDSQRLFSLRNAPTSPMERGLTRA
jgi:hypothetical protein